MIRFDKVSLGPLIEFDAAAPDGSIIGILGEDGAGAELLLRMAAGLEKPASGSVLSPASRRLLGPGDSLNFEKVAALLLNQTLARHDWVTRGRAAMALEGLRRTGCTVLMVSHDEEILRQLCDEIWWIDSGRLAGRGDPGDVLRTYREHVARKLRESGEGVPAALAPSVRRGDGRAEILGVELLGEPGTPTLVWRSGELAVVRVDVRFNAAVADPVIGMLIRTRIGLNVYGTNTELENLKLGPRKAGDQARVSFAFRCELCPAEYTLTVASHDPDGVWHEWLEDAVAFSVTDSRYTAGVANLRARASFDILETRNNIENNIE
ncbi:MAG: Wzt carbohydrate-binding domain-containing protein [Acidobacteriota bacterium]|nr:Wzt carbohydrate-binding domain-containing protein [Acidobacteriota bacterium]